MARSKALPLGILLLLAALVSGAANPAGPVRVRVETSAGAFVIQMEPERAPLTVKNFLQYVQSGFYDATIFHRVVGGFVIQGGGYSHDLTAKTPQASIANESGNGLSNRRGTIAMARENDPHSANSQFYINLADNLVLDPKPTRWGYAVFGEIVEGMDVVDDIGHRATTGRKNMQDVPLEPVVIQRMTVLSGAGP